MTTLVGARWFYVCTLAIAMFGSAGLEAAAITVTPSVTPDGALFHYNYTVVNATGDDLPVLDIVVQPGIAGITKLAAPSGFTSAYDSNLGLVSFLEDTALFGAAPIAGFSFDSPLAPRVSSFNATLLDANFNVITVSGPTTGPVVPEPGSLPLLSLIACTALIFRRRLRVDSLIDWQR